MEMGNRLFQLLRELSAFSLLSEDELQQLARSFRPAKLRGGDLLVEAGVPIEDCYLIDRGSIRVLRSTPERRSVGLAVFGNGDFFGAHAVSEDWIPSVTCRAIDDSDVFLLSRQDFEEVLQAHPELGIYFDKPLEQLATIDLLGLSTLIGAIARDGVATIVAALEECSFNGGETIIRTGQRVDKMYVIRSGNVRVTTEIDGAEHVVETLGESHHFCELGIYADQISRNTVTALDSVDCFSLDRPRFMQLLVQYPVLASQFAGRFAQYKQKYKQLRSQSRVLIPVPRTQFEAGPHLEIPALVEHLGLSKFCAGWPSQLILEFVAGLEERRLPRGGNVVVPNEQFAGINLVREGRLDIGNEEGDHGHVDRYESIGTHELLNGLSAAHKVSAARQSRIFVFPADELKRLITKDSQAHDMFSEVAAREKRQLESGRQIPSRSNVGPSVLERRLPRVKMPWVAQRTEADCGAACLAMVCRFFGIDASVRELSRLIGVRNTGANLFQIQTAAKTMGLNGTPLRLGFSEISPDQLPAIVHWRDSHFVVAYRVRRCHIMIADPEVGRIRMHRRFFEQHWNGRLLKLTLRGELGANTECGDS